MPSSNAVGLLLQQMQWLRRERRACSQHTREHCAAVPQLSSDSADYRNCSCTTMYERSVVLTYCIRHAHQSGVRAGFECPHLHASLRCTRGIRLNGGVGKAENQALHSESPHRNMLLQAGCGRALPAARDSKHSTRDTCRHQAVALCNFA